MKGTVHRLYQHGTARVASGTTRAAGGRVREKTDVEDLWNWAIRDEYAHIHAENSGLFEGEAAAAGNPLRRASADGCAQLERIAGLGIRPDGGVGLMGGHCHPDAEAAYITAKRDLPAPDFLMLLGYAKAGERPGWGAHIPRFEVRGRMTYDMKFQVLKPRGQAPFCPLVYHGPYDDGSVSYPCREAEIEAHRMLYRAWWLALRRLCYALRVTDALRRHEAVGPKAPEAPWEG